MLKAYYLLWRHASMDRKEFMEYYENTHLDLIIDNVPKHDDFRRLYPAGHRSGITQHDWRPLDALTGITYQCRESFDEAVGKLYSPPFKQVLIQDELRFLDRSLMKFVIVDEVIARGPQDKWQPAPVVADGAMLVRLVQRPAGLDSAEFRKAYDALQVPAILSVVKGCIDYRCNYVNTSDQYNFMTPELVDEFGHHLITTFDLLEELCFSSIADAEAAARALGDVGIHSSLLTGMQHTPAMVCDPRRRTY
ncbi:hypothetical protein IWW34DRAFT_223992 [Fusarium oxysporum f. sp. albedinis]|nr:hypothetical protein IWW34DRAFT_223992 [Fusarium oxysporum f. sp. albedinis]KAJ0135870.1 Uncharacterized protein HZ326_21106 [Fusarium oxysporum f. sp. albedinis]KAK2468882.1 hypothetical protein H9L39_19474 [Fusarium oxysporum f. sp. albedinis]